MKTMIDDTLNHEETGTHLKYKLRTPYHGKIGVASPRHAYIVLIQMYYKYVLNRELVKKHIFRICRVLDENGKFDLFDNRRSFSIGHINGSPSYVSLELIDDK